MNEKVIKIFIDFDGTITTKDVGEEIFLKFGDPVRANDIVERWTKDEINSIQSWQMLCDTVVDLKKNKFDEFLDNFEIVSGFEKFADYCRENNFEIKILSDGLDYYINRISQRNHLEHLEYFSNELLFNGGSLLPVFPYTDEECKICGNCKRNHIIRNSADDDYSIYIGDGYSDKCPAQFCDFIFAKKSLLKYCEMNRISYFPFNDFHDIMNKIEELKNKKRLKKRYQAELKRREVYLQG